MSSTSSSYLLLFWSLWPTSFRNVSNVKPLMGLFFITNCSYCVFVSSHYPLDDPHIDPSPFVSPSVCLCIWVNHRIARIRDAVLLVHRPEICPVSSLSLLHFPSLCPKGDQHTEVYQVRNCVLSVFCSFSWLYFSEHCYYCELKLKLLVIFGHCNKAEKNYKYYMKILKMSK